MPYAFNIETNFTIDVQHTQDVSDDVSSQSIDKQARFCHCEESKEIQKLLKLCERMWKKKDSDKCGMAILQTLLRLTIVGVLIHVSPFIIYFIGLLHNLHASDA